MIVFYFRGDVYCQPCGLQYVDECDRRGVEDNRDTDTYPQQALNNEEADTPQHCADCDEFLENPLTDEGRQYVTDKIRERRGRKSILRLWKEFYEIQT
jgi:hypothetical protein